MLERTVTTCRPVDLRLTLGQLCVAGRLDPCVRVSADGVWRATRAPDGPATIHLRSISARTIAARAWGPGAGGALERVPELLGADDDPRLQPGRSAVVDELARRFDGLRIGRTGAVLEALIPTVLAQKVVGVEARATFVALVHAAGQPAPGPMPLLLPPAPDWLATVPSWQFHRWGVEHRRAATVVAAAGYAHRLEEAAGDLAQARHRLGSLPGVGRWTVNEVAMIALGDPDAVSVGDYWLKHVVSYALTGEPRGTDERMLDLLEPWRGQRGRVCRWLMVGAPRPPRFGPRLARRAIAAL